MSTEVKAHRTLERKTRDGYLVATAQLVHYAGNKRPHFSVTGQLWDSEGWYRRGGPDGRMRACGQLHTEIARAFPQLAPVIAVHHADDDGRPMHAVANAWFAYSGEWHAYDHASPYGPRPTDTPHERAARILRIEPAELPADMDKETFQTFAESLAPRWQEDAARALAVIEEGR